MPKGETWRGIEVSPIERVLENRRWLSIFGWRYYRYGGKYRGEIVGHRKRARLHRSRQVQVAVTSEKKGSVREFTAPLTLRQLRRQIGTRSARRRSTKGVHPLHPTARQQLAVLRSRCA